MMTTSPRLRIDLQATPVEDADGVFYYDVSDPKTGNVLRLFDFEWLLAQRLDGQNSLDDLVRWTEEQLGFATSRGDLEVYAERLHRLGLMAEGVGVSAAASPSAAPPISQPVPPVAAALPEMPPRAIERPTPEPRRVEPEPIRPVARPASAADSDDGLMGRPVIALPKPQAQPVAAKPAAAPASTAAPSKAAAKPTGEPPRSALQEALEGLPAPDAEPLSQAPAVTAASAEKPAASEAAISSSPTALMEQVVKPTEAKTVQIEQIPSPSAQTPVKTPAPTPANTDAAASAQTPVKTPAQPASEPAAQAPTPAPTPVQAPTPTPAKPPTQTPAQGQATPPTPATPAKPAEPEHKAAAPQPIPPTTPEQGGAGKWIGIVLVLLAVAAGAYYFLVYKPKLTPPALGVRVSLAKIEDVPRVFPSAAEAKKAEPVLLKVESDGTVAKVAAENDEVTAATPVVVLDTQAKLEKELADLHTRIDQFQKKFDTAKGKAKQDAQTKLDEKQARLGEVEALIKKAQVLAPRPGTVSKVLCKVGDPVTAGTEVVAIADKALSAELKLPALEVQGMKLGQDVKFSKAGAENPAPVTAQVIAMKSDNEFTTLTFSLALDAPVKIGDKLSLQRGMLEKVVRVPAAALIEGNKVYVAQDGKAMVRQITVADRDGESVLVQGLTNGDSIILTHPPELHEGLAVVPEQTESAPATQQAPAPAPAAPTQAAPTQAAPTQAAPTQAAPTQAAPAAPAPAQAPAPEAK